MPGMSLRARLVLVVLAVTAVGLAASDVATATLLRSYLLGRVDQRLAETGGFAARLLASGNPIGVPTGSLPPGVSFPRGGTPDVQAARVDPAGKVVKTVQGPFSTTSDAFRTLPEGPWTALGPARRFDSRPRVRPGVIEVSPNRSREAAMSRWWSARCATSTRRCAACT